MTINILALTKALTDCCIYCIILVILCSLALRAFICTVGWGMRGLITRKNCLLQRDDLKTLKYCK